MKFRAGELEFDATVAQASEALSSQTGDVLHSLTIQFRAQKAEMHERAVEEAERCQVGGLFSLAGTTQLELEWRVRESTYQYVGSEPWGVHHHVWRIEQVERLQCERLVIGSVDLEPYQYAEEVVDDGVVRLAARAFISEPDLDALSRMTGTVEVVRVGISAASRQMSVAYVWGHRPEGLVAVVRCEDAREPHVALAKIADPVDHAGDLFQILLARGVLMEADLEELRRRRHLARRVADVDAWQL